MAKQTIGEFLATLRKANGYTQQEVADRLGISNRTLSGWECNNVLPDILLLPALSELYGVTVDEILAGERSERNEVELTAKSEKRILKSKIAKFSTQCQPRAHRFRCYNRSKALVALESADCTADLPMQSPTYSPNSRRRSYIHKCRHSVQTALRTH